MHNEKLETIVNKWNRILRHKRNEKSLFDDDYKQNVKISTGKNSNNQPIYKGKSFNRFTLLLKDFDFDWLEKNLSKIKSTINAKITASIINQLFNDYSIYTSNEIYAKVVLKELAEKSKDKFLDSNSLMQTFQKYNIKLDIYIAEIGIIKYINNACGNPYSLMINMGLKIQPPR
jgi:hypothetical protein